MNYSMFLYIDPATGGMMFTVFFGLLSAFIYFFQSVFIKLKYAISMGKTDKKNADKLPIVIFTDHKRYWNVFKPICDELEKRKVTAYYYTMSEDDSAFDCNYEYIICEFIGDGNKAFAKMNMLKATVVVSSTPSLDVFQWKRSKDVDFYIHVLHAPNDIPMYRMFGTDYYDAIFVSGEYQITQVRELEKQRKLPSKELILAGIPYLDAMKKRLSETEKIENDICTVILAPSWGENSILNKYGDKIIDAILSTGYHLIIRPHPQSYVSEIDLIERIKGKYKDDPNIEWNRDNDNFDVLNRADILISDYSGVVFDFALVYDKPIIYADIEFDKSYYDCAWIEEQPWIFGILPKIGKCLNKDNMDNIKEMIDDCIFNPMYKEGRDKARKETWDPMGVGATVMVDFILEKYNSLSVKEEQEQVK